MSVSIENHRSYSHKKQQQKINPTQQLLKNVMIRLDNIQNYRMKPYLTNSNTEGPNSDFEKIKQSIKIMGNINLENLQRLQQNVKENWEQLFDRMKNLENKMLRTLKQKQQAMEYLQNRLTSVENSQKSVTNYMKKITENQNQKFGGLQLLQGRLQNKLTGIKTISQLNYKKQEDQIQNIKSQLQEKFEKFQKMIENNLKEQSSIMNKKQKQNENKSQQLQGIQNKIKQFDLQLKQNRRKFLLIEDNIQDNARQTQKKMQQIHKKLQNISKYSKNLDESPKGSKTQNNQKNKNNERQLSTIAKKTQQNSLKPPLYGSSSKTQLKKNLYEEDNYKQKEQIKFARDSRNNSGKNSRKPSYQNQKQQQVDPFEDMRGGIRGLLKKSKQKNQRKESPRTNLGSNLNKKPLRQKSSLLNPLSNPLKPSSNIHGFQKSLPPVKVDLKRQTMVENMNYQNDEQNEQQVEQICTVDQQGYLMDQQGNYLQDQYGNRIQLSQQQLQAMMQEQQG